MLNANILLVEDTQTVQEITTSILEMDGHTVTLAPTLETATQLIDDAACEKIRPFHFALVDGHLSPHTKDGADAVAVVDRINHYKIRGKLGELVILGFSTESLREYGIPIEQRYNFTKLDIPKIADFILESPEVS